MTEVRAPRPLAQFAQSVLAVRWLALAALITLEAAEPPRTPYEVALPLYVGILVYSLGLTLLAWAFPQRAEATARLGVAFDLAAVLVGIQFSAHPREFLALGFVVCALSGILLGQIAAVLVAASIALLQLPGMPASLFSPGRHLSWGLAVLGLLFTAAAGAAGGKTARSGGAGALPDLDSMLAQGRSHAIDAALESVMTDLRADSGSIMFFDPETSRLEIAAARGLKELHLQDRPRLGEGVAGWVLQQMRPMLLTPNTSVPFELARDEIGSSLTVPLLLGTRPLGVLNLNRSTEHPWFTIGDLDRAAVLSRQVRVLLLDAQHERALSGTLSHLAAGQQEVGHALSRDPTVLWPVLLDVARTVTAARFAVLALERDDTGTIDIVSARGIDALSAKRLLPDLMTASTQGNVHAVNGQQSAPFTVCVPLHVQDRAIGAIALGGLPDGRAPHALLGAVAAHIAAAVHTARTAYRIADIGVIEERRRIAREIHDGIAQTLADALLQTDLSSMIAQSDPSKLDQDLKDLRTLLERAMRELREFMTELRRQEEPNSGLRAALDAFGKEFQRRSAIPVRLVVTGDDAHLPSAVRHAVLAIARQALTNVGSHAQANTVTIRVDITEKDCTAAITDDGVGFDLAMYRSRPQGSHHLGITSMEERAALVGGRMQLETAPGRGTTVKVTVPLGRHA